MDRDIGILVVDDEEVLRNLFVAVFVKAGYRNVFPAADGVECLRVLALKKDLVHVVLLDESMPRMSGSQTLEYLAQVHPFVVGVVFISGVISRKNYNTIADGVVSKNVIPMGFLAKPASGADLISKVDEAGGLIKEKRIASLSANQASMSASLARIEERLDELATLVSSRPKGIWRFLSELGLELLKIIVIGAAVLALLSLGIDDFIRSILGQR